MLQRPQKSTKGKNVFDTTESNLKSLVLSCESGVCICLPNSSNAEWHPALKD